MSNQLTFTNARHQVGGAVLVMAMIAVLIAASGRPAAALAAPENNYVPARVSDGIPAPTSALSADDCALLIQMTGTIADGLGVHEILDPATAEPTRTYSNTEAVQYVVLPGGCDQEIDVTTTYSPAPWDPSNGTGGVVFLGGTTLNLAADIDASEAGFASTHSVGAGCDGGNGDWGPDGAMWEGGAGGGGIFGGGGGAAGHVATLITWAAEHEFDGSPGGGGTTTAGGAGGPNGDNIGFSPDGGDAGCVGNGGSPDQNVISGAFYTTGAGAGGGGSYGGGGGACSSRSSGAYSGGGGGGGSYTGGGAGGWGGTNTGFVNPEEPGFAGNAAVAATITPADHYLHDEDPRAMMGGAGGLSFRGDGSAGPFEGGRGGGIIVLSFDAIIGDGGSVISNGGEGSTPPNFSGEGSHGASGSGGGAGGQIIATSPVVSNAFFSAVGGIGGFAVEDTSSNSQPHTGSSGASGGGGGIWFAGVGPTSSNTGENAGATSGDTTLVAAGLDNVDWAVNGGIQALADYPSTVTIGGTTFSHTEWAAIVGAANLDSQATFKPIAISLVDASAGAFTLEELIAAFPRMAQPNNPKNIGLGCGPGYGGTGLAITSAPPATIGDFVWLDLDKDGLQDPSEQPLEGVVATLSNGATATTGPDGFYSFDLAAETEFTLTFDTTEVIGVDGTSLFLSPSLTGEDTEIDSDAVDVDGVATITLTSGPPETIDNSYDVGFFQPENRIGNLVWFDANNNAVVDADEPGVAGVAVQLYKETGTTEGFDDETDTLVATTTTDANGVYWFEQVLEDMTYYVALPEDQTASTVTIGENEVDPTTLLSSTGGTLGNNDEDNGDDGDAIGSFLSVSGPIDIGNGTEPLTESDANSDPATDSEAYVEAAGGSDFNDDDSNLTVDLGLVQKIRIGNLVWLDGESGEAGFNNGAADPDESANGLGGVVVELYLDNDETEGLSEGDTLVDSQTTNPDGEYWFDGLMPGTYVLGIPADQTGQTLDGAATDIGDLFSSTSEQSLADAGIDDADDGEAAAGFAATTSPFALDYSDNPVDEAGNFGDETNGLQEAAANAATLFNADNNSDLTFDFGFVELPAYRLGNLIWWDLDNDGLAEADEPGIENVVVELWVDGGEEALQTTTTDEQGRYLFEGLRAGDYYISVPAGQTGQMVGARSVDLEDLTATANPVADPDNPDDIDNDNDGNPAPVDPSDQPTTSGVISLGDPDQFTPSEPTNETLRSDDPTDDDPVSDTDTLPDAQSNLTVDIGFVGPVRVGNVVWLDDGGRSTDGDGEREGEIGFNQEDEDDGQADISEAGIEGVLVQLIDETLEVAAETVTDANGVYVFDFLEPGPYRVAIPVDQTPIIDRSLVPNPTALDALRSSTGKSVDPEAADDDDDGEAAEGYLSISDFFDLGYGTEPANELGDFQDPTAGAAEEAVNLTHPWLPDTNSNLQIDFGFAPIPTYQLGNLIWEDYDNDGIAEVGEPGLVDVLVQLLDESGEVIAETTTDLEGHYLFTNLPAGEYRVRVPGEQAHELPEPQLPNPDALVGLKPASPATADPDNPADADNDSNNLRTENEGDFITAPLTLGEGSGGDEPLGETGRADDPTLDEDGLTRDDRSNLTVDLGFWRGLRLGNQVFLDGDQTAPGYDNGTFDEGELGIGGVSVDLFIDDGDGVFEPRLDDGRAIDTVITDTEGNYFFDGLDDATPYFVAIQSVPNGFSSTGQSTEPTASDNDDDGSPAAGYAAVGSITLNAGTSTIGEADVAPAEDAEAEANAAGSVYLDGNSELSVDFGFIEVPLYRIGNLVWEDLNANGVVDPSEPGIAGVLVQLIDDSGEDLEVIAETLTSDEGVYAFENLLAGTYRVQIPTNQTPVLDDTLDIGSLDGFVSSTAGEEADPDLDVDNNDNGVGDGDWVSGEITLGSNPLAPSFGTEPVDETNIATGADDDPDTGVAGAYPDSHSNYSVDFGFYRLSLGNQVWFDTNDNGIADEDEAGIAAVKVNLYEVTLRGPENPEFSTLVDTVETDESGLYLFDGLAAGATYVVEVDAANFAPGAPLENLFSSTDPDTGAVDPDGDETVPGDGIDGDDNGIDAPSQGLAVASEPVLVSNEDEPTGELPNNDLETADTSSNLSVDFGFHNGLRIGSLVWIDDGSGVQTDENGLADATESGVAGVAVQLFLDDGPISGEVSPGENTLVAVTESAEGGRYAFEHLAPATYLVMIPQAEFEPEGDLAGHVSTLDGASDGATNNDDDGVLTTDIGVIAGPIELAFGEAPDDEATTGTSGEADEDGTYRDTNSNLTIDLGFVETPLYRIGNLVWEDLDADGIAEVDEPGIAGVLVQLLDERAEVIAETITDELGSYSFDELPAGDYVVKIPAEQTPLVDLDLLPTAVLDGLVSSGTEEADPNNDGDNNDNGLGLTDWATAPITVGEGILGGEPTDETVRADDPTDDDLGDPVGSPDARSNYSVDLGFYRLTLGNQVWFDIDANGIADAGEPGINGVSVELYEVDANGETTLVDTTETATVEDVDGIYSFDGLTDGSEYVVVIPAEELEEGGPLHGTFSTPDPEGGVLDPDGDETIAADGIDGDDSGQDAAESGEPTDPAGDVASLPVTVNVGDEPVGESPGSENLPVIGPDTSSNLTVDFGFVGLSIGDTLWLDLNEDGVQGEDEIAGVAETTPEGVVLELWPADEAGLPLGDEPLAVTTTDIDGTYNFVALVPGDYIVRVPEENFAPEAPLDGWVSTAGNGTTAPDPDDDVDGDDNGDPSPAEGWVQSRPVTIDYGTELDPELEGQPTGSANFTVDFGFVPTPPMSIGNSVWLDANNSGTVDDDEPGLPGVLVELFAADEAGQPNGDEPVATTTTDDDGYYLFVDIAPGEYVVVVPESNFDELADPLFGFASSSTSPPTDPDDDVDGDDEGLDPLLVGDDVVSQPILLHPTLEPIETDLGPDAHGTGEDGPIEDIDSNLTVDFGFYTLSIGDQVFLDTDNSGTMDEGEEGIAGVVVHLVNDDGQIIATTETDEEGRYLLAGFPEGDYQIMVDESNFAEGAALERTYSSDGNDVAGADGVAVAPDADDVLVDNDDNGSPEGGHNTALWTEPVTIGIGEEPVSGAETSLAVGFDGTFDSNSDLTVDIGVYAASFAAPLWSDDNGDGIVDSDEEAFEGVVVNLIDSDVVATTTSGTDGLFEFDGLPEGTYQVEVVAENFAPDGALAGRFDGEGEPESLVSEPFDVMACDCENIIMLDGLDLTPETTTTTTTAPTTTSPPTTNVPVTSGPLAFTGGDPWTFTGFGALLVLFGIAMLAVSRRRGER